MMLQDVKSIKQVTATINNQIYTLVYNPQTDYYEIEVVAPEETGLHNIEIEYTSSGLIATENMDLIVLAKESVKVNSHEIIAYFLDKANFEIKDVAQLTISEINQDMETNGNSIFYSPKKLEIEENDYIYLKEDDKQLFFGIIQKQEDENESGRYKITCKDIMAMLDFSCFEEDAEIIKNIGIEDFLSNRILKEFVNNDDYFVNKSYLEVNALTHTPKNISLTTLANITNGIYNFLTFANNAIKNYDLQFDFEIKNKKLIISISTKNTEKILIDTTTSDVSEYSETFSLEIVSKVEVYIKETEEKYYRYLLNDRTTTTDSENPNRVIGKTEKVVVEKKEDAEQTALDKFKSNTYNHNITFKINKNSKLHDISSIKIGTPIQIKTKNSIIKDTYISSIKSNDDEFLTVVCGNIRVNYIDKFLQERRKSK